MGHFALSVSLSTALPNNSLIEFYHVMLKYVDSALTTRTQMSFVPGYNCVLSSGNIESQILVGLERMREGLRKVLNLLTRIVEINCVMA